jgi:hypothetical protein
VRMAITVSVSLGVARVTVSIAGTFTSGILLISTA